MRARLLLNLALLLALLLLTAWLWQERQPRQPARLANLPPAAVQRLWVERRQGPTLEFVRHATGWQMRQPRQLPASEQHVQMLLGFLQLPVQARYPETEVDLAALGLQQPSMSLQAEQLRFQFGALEPLHGRRYLRHGGEVLLVQEGVSALLASPWWNFIDRRLLPAGVPQRLHFADGVEFAPPAPATWAAHWRQETVSIVRPAAAVEAGELFELELDSGERIPWRWRDGEQPVLFRPDLGLQYQVSAEQLNALLGR
jgi:hypothetical protein